MKRFPVGAVLLLSLAACGQQAQRTNPTAQPSPVSTTPTVKPLDLVQISDTAVVVPGEITKGRGESGTAILSLVAQDGDGAKGCNATSGHLVTITVTSSNTNAIPHPGSVQVAGCSSADAKTLTYTVDSKATPNTEVTLTAVGTGGKSGSTNTAGTFKVKIVAHQTTDTTPPVVNARVEGTVGNNNWYTSNVLVYWDVTDAESAISSPECVTETVTSDTTSAGTTFECTATSAGGTTKKSITIKRDATAPMISGENIVNTTWRNTSLSSPEFSASDSGSGLTVSSPAKFTLTASNESANATEPTLVSQTITDNAGNTATRTLSALIDKTAPVVSTNVADSTWRNTDFVANFTASDSLSGLAKTSDTSFIITVSAESPNATTPSVVTYTVTDKAGNNTTRQASAMIDKTAPVISGDDVLETAWRNTDLSRSFTANDSLSGLTASSRSSFTLTAAAESAGASSPTVVMETVTDQAGNSATRTISALIDKTAPILSAKRSIEPNIEGWNNSNVTVTFTCNDALSGLSGSCPADQVFNEGANQSATASVTDRAGNIARVTENNINIDKTPPTIVASADRAPNGMGWYNADVTVSFRCSDSLSGLNGSCPVSKVLGEGADQRVSASVTDKAGNTANASLSGINVDKTAPVALLAASGTKGNDNWYLSDVSFSTAGSNDTLSGLKACTAVAPLNTDTKGTEVSTTCTDVAGNTAQAKLTVKRDTVAPIISGADINEAVWRNTDLSAAFTASDETSGLTNPSDASFTLTASDESTLSAPTTVRRTVTDAAGNQAVRVLSAKIDKTAPEVTSALAAQPDGTNGWYKTDILVNFTCTDALSGCSSNAGSDTVTTEGSNQSASWTVTDQAGNSRTGSVTGLKLDKTKPIATLTRDTQPNAQGWNNTDVAVKFSCTDAVSGCVAAEILQTVTGEGSNLSASGSVQDRAGHVSDIITLNGIKIDRTLPTLNPAFPSEIFLGTSVSVDSRASDALSGILSASCGALDTSSVGTKTVSCTATDKAENSVTQSYNYTVTYNFTGFFQPISMNAINVVKAGSAVPVKFSIGGDHGLNIVSASSSTSACDATAPLDTDTPTVAAGNSSLSYDAASGQYVYVWKTEKSWSGCRRLTLTFKDNSTRSVNFKF